MSMVRQVADRQMEASGVRVGTLERQRNRAAAKTPRAAITRPVRVVLSQNISTSPIAWRVPR